MDLIIKIKNIDSTQLAHLLISEKMGLEIDELQVINEGKSVEFNRLDKAAAFIMTVINTAKSILKN